MFVGFRYYIDESEYSEGIREHFFVLFCFVLFCFVLLFFGFLWFWFINLTTSSTLFYLFCFHFITMSDTETEGSGTSEVKIPRFHGRRDYEYNLWRHHLRAACRIKNV